MKKDYIRPTIKRQFMGMANKFGSLNLPQVISEIDGNKIEDLMKEFGSPLFIFSENLIRKKIKEFKNAFESRYPNFQPTWSYKTNYLNSICKIFHEEGFWAEVVSSFEYQKARLNGVSGNKIIYNGPSKSYDSLKLAITEGAKIHIDHLDELNDILKISTELEKSVSVSLRINLDTGTFPNWNRFGFNLESGQALEAARKISHSNGKLKLIGVHAHIGTFVLETNAYKIAAKKISDFYLTLRDELKQPMNYIDLGGGYPSNNKLKSQYLNTSYLIPNFDSYAEIICKEIYDAFSPDEPPTLFTESGRAMIDEAGFLASSVVGTKLLPNGKRAYIMNAGVNLLYTSTWYDYKISILKNSGFGYEDSILYGPLCMNIDIIRENCLLPNLVKGDSILIHPVGAYNVTQWMQFIEMRPAVVLIDSNQNVKLIRKKETVDDINSFEL